MSKLYHITVFFDNFNEERDLATTFNEAEDWLRYAPSCWIVATDESAFLWYKRLKEVVGSGGNIFITALTPDVEKAGLLRRNVWQWMNKHGLNVETDPPVNQ